MQEEPPGRELAIDAVHRQLIPNIKEAIDIAIKTKGRRPVEVKFYFRGIEVCVRKDSDPVLIERDYQRAVRGYIENKVGPYPHEILTKDELESDRQIQIALERRAERREAARQEELEVKRQRIEALLADAPELTLENEGYWNEWRREIETADYTQPDYLPKEYRLEVMRYARRWGRLMQLRINQGEKLEHVAFAAAKDARVNDSNGDMYYPAVMLLAGSWIHGDKLQVWHTLRTGLKDEA